MSTKTTTTAGLATTATDGRGTRASLWNDQEAGE
jgi:hypothetical protein